jgi:hypothetical protein
MKNAFIEYNPLSKETLKVLWDNAIFIFDTSVLLNLYRYSDETLNNFLETILKLNNRVWLPYQVGFEFNRNRLSVISDQIKRYKDFEKKINDIINEIENKNRNPFLSEDLFKRLISIKGDIFREIDVKVKTLDDSLNSDLLLDKINTIFEGKIGNCNTIEELKQIYNEGEKRYQERIPPGYCDIKKPENERFGDLILWKQIITKVKNEKFDIIFVLDDRKEDWWLEHQGKTISPRPELLKEFKIETERICHFYKPSQFLEYSNKYLGNTIKEQVIEEVKNYNPKIDHNDNFIQINLTLQGKIADLNLLIAEMKNAGYDVYTELNNIGDVHEVFIILPNIPDLERRLNSKYLSNLVSYNINLIRSLKK